MSGDEGGCQLIELHWCQSVWFEGSGILPSGLCCVVVVQWTVDHGFEWFVIFSMNHEILELILEESSCGVHKRLRVSLRGRVMKIPLFVDHGLPLFGDWLNG